jgi:hypothetical protein
LLQVSTLSYFLKSIFTTLQQRFYQQISMRTLLFFILAPIIALNVKMSNNILTRPKVGGNMPAGKRPDWFRVPAPGGNATKFNELKKSVKELGLHTGQLTLLTL